MFTHLVEHKKYDFLGDGICPQYETFNKNNMVQLMLQCPNAEEKSKFIAAIHSGYITWHAGPMNLQVEMAHDRWLFEAGLDLSLQLDQRFAITRSFHVLSQRDVPGLTFALLTSLSDTTNCHLFY